MMIHRITVRSIQRKYSRSDVRTRPPSASHPCPPCLSLSRRGTNKLYIWLDILAGGCGRKVDTELQAAGHKWAPLAGWLALVVSARV